VDLPDLVRFFSFEPAVEVIAIYLEGLGRGEGREFFDLAKKSKKAIITYKAGRTEAGARAAASHTAAISGSYEVFKAAADQAGIVLIEELPAFYDAVKAFSMLSRLVPKGRRVAGLVNAGLDATMSADLLGVLEQAVLSPETVRRLEKINTHGLVNLATSFLDVTPMTNDIMFGDFLDALLSDPDVDCAFAAVVPHVENLKTTDDECRDPDAVATRLIAATKRHSKPVVVSVNAGNHYLGFVKYLEEGGLPVFTDIRSAITALDSFVSYHVK
jgi:3-hydroxypropionyl-CoA synthetase (ADP-forming)